MTINTRHDGRGCNQLRPVNIQYNTFGYAAGSVLLEMGNTKALCAVTMQNGVPPFLRGKGTGWLSAEYAMLPTSTVDRSAREISQLRRNGRASEISRLISRALRMVVNLDVLGERTITIDCDVLQADGGTRAACITGAFCALKSAEAYWLKNKQIMAPILIDEIAAVSVGVLQDQIVLDPDFSEDSKLSADFNFVLTRSNMIVEMQGSAERSPIAWEQYNQLMCTAQEGIAQLFDLCNSHDNHVVVSSKLSLDGTKTEEKKAPVIPATSRQPAPFFSLLNRQNST
jgi:ribonuclease PH